MTNPTPEAIEELVKRLQALLDADPDTKIFDIRRNDLADMLTALSQRQRVKPLVWGSDGRSGEYIVWSLHSDCWLVNVGAHVMGGILYGAYQRKFKTIDAAKAAAQADYEAHILSALEPDPTGGWCSDMEAAPRDEGWIRTADRLPEKPGKSSYEYVRCLIFVNGDTEIGMWNCEHLCWDDDEGDDFRYHPTEPTHWQRITPPVRGQEKGGRDD